MKAPLTRTDIARCWREAYGGTRMDASAEDFARRVEFAAIEALGSPPDDGGPAFPVAYFDHQIFKPKNLEEARRLVSGISMRDYFAAQALAGIEASQGNSGHFVSTAEKVAIRAYELADAMLKARG